MSPQGAVIAVLLVNAFLGTAVAAPEEVPTCPPEGFDTVKDLDINKYISAPWYVQEQMPVSYQPVEDLFCVRAHYEFVNDTDPTQGLIVYNYANQGEVNGPPMGTSGSGSGGFQLKAVIPDPNEASKLLVGPGFLEQLFGRRIAELFYGDYWVVAVGPSEDPELGYDWAIISGGAPKTRGAEGCVTGNKLLDRFQVNGAGFWLFARKPVDPESTEKMREVAKDIGFDLSVLEKVEQEGCKYEGAL